MSTTTKARRLELQRPPQVEDRGQPLRPSEQAGLRFIERAWLEGPQTFACWTSSELDFEQREPVAREIFTAMVILEQLEQTRSRSVVGPDILQMLRRCRTPQGLHHFFVDRSLLPADADCTAIAHSLLWARRSIGPTEARVAANQILRNTDQSGVIAVYFTDEASRKDIIDPAVCANALHFLAMLDVTEGTDASERFLLSTLESRAYEAGTRYYPSPDAFLYFLARMVSSSPARFPRFAVPLRLAVLERQSANRRPLDMAFRILAADLLQLPAHKERRALVGLQRANGSWPADVFFRYGRSPRFFGSEALTTAFSLRAAQL